MNMKLHMHKVAYALDQLRAHKLGHIELTEGAKEFYTNIAYHELKHIARQLDVDWFNKDNEPKEFVRKQPKRRRKTHA